jgi:hypothetical protein
LLVFGGSVIGVWRGRQVQIRRHNFDLPAKHSSFVQHLLKAALNRRDIVETPGSCALVWDDFSPLESLGRYSSFSAIPLMGPQTSGGLAVYSTHVAV